MLRSNNDKTTTTYKILQNENSKKIAIIIAPKDYQDMEFGVPYNYFLDNHYFVEVYSTKKGIAVGAFGSQFDVEHDLSELDVKKYDAIAFVGGAGTKIVRDDERSIKILQDAVKNDKIIGAICWSPTILAKAGILRAKNATVWYGNDPEFKMLTSEYLEEQGANYTDEDVTVDGNIITANGPKVALRYSQAIVKKLKEE
jgi:protease I